MGVKPPNRKPRVKSVEEKQNSLIHPYKPLGRGNPNPTVDHNRGNDVSVDGDQFKDPVIGLGDFWEAIKYYVENKVKPSVIVDNQQVAVPLEYAFPERWFAAEKQGYLRDKDGRMLLPVIAIKRDTITRNRSLGNKLDGNLVHQVRVFKTGYSSLNQYDNFSVLTNSVPRREFRICPVPDYVTVTYNCSVYCNFQSDLDRVIQAFSYVSDSYWGHKDLWAFKAQIDTFTDTIEYVQGDDRSVRADFDLTINGYLLPDTIERDLSVQKKLISNAQVVLRAITVQNMTDIKEIRRNNNSAAFNIVENNKPVISNDMLSSDVIKYIDANKNVNSVSVSSNSATFSGAFLSAPTGFPATSVDNFMFFANGQYIDKSSIVSFIDNGSGQCTLIINTSTLGYSFAGDYIITAVGKFA